jgi:hypothetical protein
MDLEVREVIMAEELKRNLRRSDGRDLAAELYKAHMQANEIADD